MNNIIWLASWYPNKYDLYNGDFIQRHAIAVSPYCNLTVVTIQFVPQNWQKEAVIVEKKENGELREIIIYLQQSNLATPFNKLVDQWRYMKMYKKTIKEYLKENNPSLVHVHVPVKAGIIGLWLKRKLGIKLIVSEHWGIYNNHALDKYITRSWWFKRLVKKVLTNADTFITVSNNLGESINKMVVAKPFKVINNVVNTHLFYHTPFEISSTFWFIHVSMMNHPKNPKGIIDAFARVVKENKNCRLRMVGNANKQLIAYASSLGLNNYIEFTGMLPKEEVANLMRQSHAFILFSNYENMPCVIAESLCCGVPVIATNVGGIPEVIDSSNGILVEPENTEGLAIKMRFMLDNSLQYDKRNIATVATNKYCYEIIGKQLLAIYQNAY